MKQTRPLYPVVLDVDTGEDDALAILLAVALQVPLHVVLTSYGNTTLANATANTAALLQLAGASHVPIIQGADAPLRPHPHPEAASGAGDFVGRNGLCNVEVPPATQVLIHRPHPADLATTWQTLVTGRVQYVVTGPCTNLARLLDQLGERAAAYIDHIYLMAGALDGPGNSGPRQLAEFNVYCDAEACARVLASGLPVTMVSWDVTQHITIPYADVMQMRATTAVGDVVLRLMRAFLEQYGLVHQRNFELNDPITVLAALGVGRVRQRTLRVVTAPDGYGQTLADPHGVAVRWYEALSPTEHQWYVEAVLNALGVVYGPAPESSR